MRVRCGLGQRDERVEGHETRQAICERHDRHVTSGDYALDVPMDKMSKDYDVAGTVEALGKLVPSNNDLTLESFLKEKIKNLISENDKHDVGYYYNRLLYSTGDAVPAILSDIRVSYTDNDGTKIVKSRTD